jgi:DNA invertase Pin-like site-specific DNA recombinase
MTTDSGTEAMMRIGYARVSTRAQGDSLDTQEAILREHGCERVFRDTISGAKSSRPEFDEMLKMLRSGDEVFATRLDRLGRTALDTLHTIDRLNASGVHVVLLKPELDTRTK